MHHQLSQKGNRDDGGKDGNQRAKGKEKNEVRVRARDGKAQKQQQQKRGQF